MGTKRSKSDDASDVNERTVRISRVSKVVKGGRRFSFSALVVAGDGAGRVGFGLGKSSEVPDAIRKAGEQARRNMIKFPLREGTVPHEVLGRFGPSSVVIKPAAPGTGVIAGAAVRAVLELAGVTDIRTKCIGSNRANNVLEATMDGLLQLVEPEIVAELRGQSIENMQYQPF